MHRFLLAAIALATSIGSAFAADLPAHREAPVYVTQSPAFSWTGFYVGADIGGAFGSTSVDQFISTQSSNTAGVLGGGYIGYNYQFSPNFVLGVEGDFQGAGSSSSRTHSELDGGFGYFGTITNKQNWLAAANGRLGVVYERALFYAIGGAAWAQDKVTSSTTQTGIGARRQTFFESASVGADLFGFDVGGGVEYAFNSNWAGRIEYRYYDFGPYRAQQGYTGSERTSVNTVRVGLAYLFSAPAPALAKY